MFRIIKMESYCVKCKRRRKLVRLQGKYAKNGRPMIGGTFDSCGSKCTRFVSEKDMKSGGFLSKIFRCIGLGVQRP